MIARRVERLADERVSDRREVNAKLVIAAGPGNGTNERRVGKAKKDTVVGAGGAGVPGV